MKLLHFDLETAPNKVYAWGLWKQNIAINQIEEPGYTMCFAAKWEGSKEVIFDSFWKSGFEAMLEHAWELLNEADAVIHYNGKKFDIPVLNWEFVQQDWEPPDPYHQIDLYQVVKQRFRIPSNKLDYVAKMLGFEGKIQHKGMDLWKECMDGNKKSQKEMELYNRQDVILLPKVYKKLLPWIKNHPNHALYMDTDRPVCPNCGSEHVIKKGTETTLTMQYQRYRCADCLTPIRGRSTVTSQEKKSHILTQSKL